MSQANRGERRRSERFGVHNAYAKFRRRGAFFSGPWNKGALPQVSRHGMLLDSSIELDYGDRIEAFLHLAAYNEPLHVRGRVVRVKPEGRGFRAGVEFVSMNKNDARKLDKNFYAESLIGRRDTQFIQNHF